MSHFVDFKTQMSDLEALIRALVKQGFKRDQIEIHGTAAKLTNNYDSKAKKANVIIRAKNNGISADIGWEFDKAEGVYVSHIDEYEWGGKPHYGKDWQEHLTQFYNLEKSKMLCDENGLEYEESVEQGDPVLLAKFKVENDPEKLTVEL